jgi:uncharacterized protein (DUF302 family)
MVDSPEWSGKLSPDHQAAARVPNAISFSFFPNALIANPLIMKQLTELVPDAAAYAPVTILIDERRGKVHVSYDRMASLLSAYNNPAATKIAESLDAKIEALMHAAL